MTYVTKIVLENYGPFLGEHELALGPGVYGVVARRVSDPRRSNAVGKTTLMNVARHVVYGEQLQESEDGWISDGEKKGSARVELSDGSFAEISRRRGGSTRFAAKIGGRESSGKEARAAFVENVV